MTFLRSVKSVVMLRIALLSGTVLCLVACGTLGAEKARIPLFVGEPVGVGETKVVRLVLHKTSDVTVTTYHYSGAFRTGSTTTHQFDYKPDKHIKESLEEAGFVVLSKDSEQNEDATLFVRYREGKRQPGLDAATAYYFSFVFYHRTAGELLEGGTTSGGLDSVEELENAPQFRDIGILTKNSLTTEAAPQYADITLSKPKVNFRDGLIAQIPEDIESPTHVTLSPDRKTVAYAGRKEKKNLIMLGDTEVDEFDRLIDRIVFHPNGMTLGYTIQRNGAQFLGIDGKAGYAFPKAAGLSFSPDGEQYAYIADTGEKRSVIINGKRGEAFDVIKTMVSFSSKGDAAYWAESQNTLFLVVNDQKTAMEWKDVTTPNFSPDGEVAYAGKRNDEWFLVTGAKEDPLNIQGNVVAGPFFGPDGETYALIIERGDSTFVRLNSREMRKFKGQVGIPVFSGDGKHVAYPVTEGSQEFVVVDDKEGERYDEILSPILFDRRGNSISFGARKGREVYLRVIDLAKLKEVITKREIWKAEVGRVRRTDQPVVAEGLVYLATQTSTVRAMDAKTGEDVWRYRTTSYNVTPRYAVGQGVVALLHPQHAHRKCHVLDAKTGTELWTFSPPGQLRSFTTPPVVADDLIYVGTRGAFHALNIGTGKEMWKMTTSSTGPAAPIVTKTMLFFVARNTLRAISRATKVEAWKRESRTCRLLGADLSEGIIYIGEEKTLCAIHMKSGEDLWKFQTGGRVESAIIVNGKVYLGSTDGKLYALNAKTGDEVWSHSVGCAIQQAEIADGVIYYGREGNLYAVRADSGSESWRYETEGKNITAPAIYDGMIYFAAGDTLYAVAIR